MYATPPITCFTLYLPDPPGKQFHPDVFGMASWSSVINAVDQGSKGFVILRKDVGSFFEKYNVK